MTSSQDWSRMWARLPLYNTLSVVALWHDGKVSAHERLYVRQHAAMRNVLSRKLSTGTQTSTPMKWPSQPIYTMYCFNCDIFKMLSLLHWNQIPSAILVHRRDPCASPQANSAISVSTYFRYFGRARHIRDWAYLQTFTFLKRSVF